MNSLLFQHVTVIDGSGSAPRTDMDVLVSDGYISAVETHGLLAYDEQETEVYDLSGMTLLPGLIDCHVHIMMDGGPEGRVKPEESLGFCLLRAAYAARCTLEAGITTVRDLGGQAHLEFALREAIAAGYCSGPRLVLAGKLLSMTSAGTEAFAGMYREADGADEVRKAAREQLKAGANVIKAIATGAVMTPGEEPGAWSARPGLRATLDERRAGAGRPPRRGPARPAGHPRGCARGRWAAAPRARPAPGVRRRCRWNEPMISSLSPLAAEATLVTHTFDGTLTGHGRKQSKSRAQVVDRFAARRASHHFHHRRGARAV